MKAIYETRVSLNWWCFSVRSERLIKLKLSWCLSVNEHTWRSYIIIVLENLLTIALLRWVSFCWGKEHWLLGFDFQTNIVTRLWDLWSEIKQSAVLWYLQGRRFFTSCTHCHLVIILSVHWLVDDLLLFDSISVLAVFSLYVVSASSSLYNNTSQIGLSPLSKVLT